MARSNNIETRYLEQEEYNAWDTFVDQSPDGTIFHKTTWLKPMAQWQQLNFSIAVCFKGGKIAGGMAFTWKKKFGRIPVIQMPVKTPFFSPVISCSDTKYRSRIESQVQVTVNALTGFLMSEYQLFHAQFPPSFTDIRPFAWNGFKTGIHYTYKAEFDEKFNISSIVESDINRRTKKASQLSYDLHEDASELRIGQAWDLEQRSFERQEFQLHNIQRIDFVSFIQTLVNNNIVKVYTIVYEDNPISSIVLITDLAKRVAYYWMAGADKNYLSTGLNQLLLLEVIGKYQLAGFNSFDLVGADTESIARYKSTINFPLVPMYSVSKARGLAKLGMMVKKFI